MVKNRVLYSIAFLAWCVFPLFAVEEELGQYGESYFRYQSLDELKPFVVLSVASPHELGLTQERLTGLKIAYEIFERSQDKSEQDRSFGRQLRDYEPLVRMLLDLDVHRPLGAVLFASEETMYPFLFFHKKTDHSTAELQSVTLWNRTFLSEPDLELGVTRRPLFQWKSQGKLAFVTVKVARISFHGKKRE